MDAFPVSQIPPSMVCYNHKVASPTWISTFVQLLGDTVYFQQLSQSGAFYQWENSDVFLIKRNDSEFSHATSFSKAIARLSPKSYQELMKIVNLGNHLLMSGILWTDSYQHIVIVCAARPPLLMSNFFPALRSLMPLLPPLLKGDF